MTEDRVDALLAHDLRTPLTVIVGYAELLRLRDDDETRRDAAEQILGAAARLSALLDELLDELSVRARRPPE